MIRTLCLCALAFGLFGLLLATPQPADAGGHWRCWKISESAKGINEARVAGRATRQLQRAIRRYGRKHGFTPRVGPTRTSCHPTGKRVLKVECTAWARVCR